MHQNGRIIDATIGQRLLWALDRVRGSSGALNCPALCKIEGPLSHELFNNALLKLAEKHDALRARLIPGRHLSMVVDQPSPLPLKHFDLRDGNTAQRAAEIIRQDLNQKIDITSGAARLSLIRLSEEEHIFLLNMHHMMTDLSSAEILIQDLATALRQDEFASVSNEWSIADYGIWESQQDITQLFFKQNRYWRQRLAGMSPIPCPLDPGRADKHGSKGLLELSISADTRRKLDNIAEKTRCSTFAVLLAILFICTYVKSGQRDLAVASLFSNRSKPELRRTVGFFVNMLMLRIIVPKQPSFIDFVVQCHRTIIGAINHTDLPFQALSPPPPKMHARPNARYDDMVFHAAPQPLETRHNAGDCIITNKVPEVVGRFDLELAVRPTSDSYVIRLSFNEKRLDKAKAKKILSDYVTQAERVAETPDQTVEVLSA